MEQTSSPQSASNASVSQFILIDDDHVNNTICQMTIELAIGKVQIKSFTSAAAGLEYIHSYQTTVDIPKSILLLDINMPLVNGWEFLERFDNLPQSLKAHFDIYILSSSVDERDRHRAHANRSVKEFLVKPITKEIVKRIFG